VRFSGESVTNLYMGLVRRMGVDDVPRIGDSTGAVAI
jgi:hypothetical protein